MVVEPDVAVGVDEPGHDPALGRRLGARLRLERDPPVDDVQVARLAVGEHGAAEPLEAIGMILNVSSPSLGRPR